MSSIISKTVQVVVAVVLLVVVVAFAWLYTAIVFGVPADPLFELLFGQTLEPGSGIDTGGHL